MKTERTLTRFGLTFGTLRFDENFLCNTLLGSKPCWDYNSNNSILVDSPGVYNSEKKYKIEYKR